MPKPISTPKAPTPIGAYSQGMIHDNVVFLSGQIGLNPNTGLLCQDSLKLETKQALANSLAVLEAAECKKTNVINTTIYLTDMCFFDEVNTAYAYFFGNHHPARATIAVAGLPKQARVEISMVAIKA